MNITSQRLIFVTGKGGVGKSACAAAVAWKEAQKGRKVCLVELGGQSFYEPYFETRGIGYDPMEVVPDIQIANFTADEALKEYVLHYLRVPKLYNIFFQNRVMKAFFSAAPAIAELAILGKLTSEIRDILPMGYDVFVVDCYSTGHALALFRAPRGVAQAIKAGPVHEQAQEMLQVLCNPDETYYYLVTIPEELPTNETIELQSQLKEEFSANTSVICTRLMFPPISDAAQDSLERAVEDKNMGDFIEFVKFKNETQRNQLAKLREIDPEFFGVPLVLNSKQGQEHMEEIATYLETPWDLRKP